MTAAPKIPASWAKAIAAAQLEPLVRLGGKAYGRVRYGKEYPDWDPSEYCDECHDCGVQLGQLHVPNCDVERCPSCGGQLISCDCAEQWGDPFAERAP